MNSNMLSALMNMGQSQPKPQQNTNIQMAPPIDPDKMKQMIPNLTKENLVQLVQRARMQGIPEDQIEQGLNFILSLK